MTITLDWVKFFFAFALVFAILDRKFNSWICMLGAFSHLLIRLFS